MSSGVARHTQVGVSDATPATLRATMARVPRLVLASMALAGALLAACSEPDAVAAPPSVAARPRRRTAIATTTTTTPPDVCATDAACAPRPTRTGRATGCASTCARTNASSQGDLAVVFTPDVATDRLVFRLWPNGPRLSRAGARLDTDAVTVDGAPAVAADRRHRRCSSCGRVPRSPPGRRVEVRMTWQLAPSRHHSTTGSRVRATRCGWARSSRSSRGSRAWAGPPRRRPRSMPRRRPRRPPTSTSPSTVPEGLAVLAERRAGHARPLDRDGDARLRAVGRAASPPSPPPRTCRTRSPSTVGVHAGVRDTPRSPTSTRRCACSRTSACRFGSYPWPTYTVALTPGLRGGIEYPGHTMQGPEHDRPHDEPRDRPPVVLRARRATTRRATRGSTRAWPRTPRAASRTPWEPPSSSRSPPT